MKTELFDDTGCDGIALHDSYLGLQFCVHVETHGHHHLLEAEITGTFQIEQQPRRCFISLGKKERDGSNQEHHCSQATQDQPAALLEHAPELNNRDLVILSVDDAWVNVREVEFLQ